MSYRLHSGFILAYTALTMVAACNSNTSENISTDDMARGNPGDSVSRTKVRSEWLAVRVMPGYDEIKQRYDLHAGDYDRLASQLKIDRNVTELYCDDNMVVVTTSEETFYDGKGDPYTTKYEGLCRFTSKVAAHSGEQGVRIPHSFFEVGPLMVTSTLEKKADSTDPHPLCDFPLFEGERGTCAVPINKDWSATYE